ncbi:acetyl-CoA carboxylase biotin carboxyl carrier protein [Jeotgalibacillus haloalkalitolerans]|uniref:Biotin carboxyl carrier protein of acetyl-CoA carboxylase n=1 Tax=Jeotgalibacillus haloalkalitolerans TaxID=3104292 RepID=A0ABU5KLV9_9BACL|nr:acetyl-CoA carboxylase biotin carboxyl carrier protein [Jeotgalibacillus sp. HH7-29]MDZ5712127.1 acetyl-CoA carboxylase biotin carboxyl carrier protein [Jeotgalibacillus sp. HH7-29]
MLKVQEIREIIKLIDQSSIDEFTYEQDGEKLKLRKQSKRTAAEPAEPVQSAEPAVKQAEEVKAPAPAEKQPEPVQETKPEPAADLENTTEIKSPMVGTFYEASSPDAEAFVKVGSKVTADSTVCIVEAMKLFNEIEAETEGEIVKILVENGQLVEYGQPLFLVKK